MDSLAINFKIERWLYVGLLLLFWYWAIVLLKPGLDGAPPWIFLDFLNLLIHEAGHWIWLPFGATFSILGGSLTQCLMPTVFGGYFAYRKEWAGMAFGLFWLGDNLINVSYYIADARSRMLPLLGGDSSGHDWHNLLSRWGMLGQDRLLAQIVHFIGLVGLVASLLLLAVIILNNFSSDKQA